MLQKKIVVIDISKKPVNVKFTPEYTIKFYFSKMKNGKERYKLMEKERMLKIFATLLPEIADVNLHNKVSEVIKELINEDILH